MPLASSTTRPLLKWPPKTCFDGCARSLTTRRRNRSPSRSRSTGKIRGSTTTREANSFSLAALQGLLNRRTRWRRDSHDHRDDLRSASRFAGYSARSATSIQAPGSIRTTRSGSATRKTIGDGTWSIRLDRVLPRFLPHSHRIAHKPPGTSSYAAEGSDWFWWYGDDFDTDYKEEFDRLFRTHLQNVWTIAGLTPPDLLNQPISSPRSMPDADLMTAPLALLNLHRRTRHRLFRVARSRQNQDSAAARRDVEGEGVLTDIQFGWSLDQLFLRLDPDEQSQPRQAGLTVELQLQTPAARVSPIIFTRAVGTRSVYALTETGKRILAGDRPLSIDLSSEYR